MHGTLVHSCMFILQICSVPLALPRYVQQARMNTRRSPVSSIINLLRFIMTCPSSSRHLANLPSVNAVALESSSTSVVLANMSITGGLQNLRWFRREENRIVVVGIVCKWAKTKGRKSKGQRCPSYGHHMHAALSYEEGLFSICSMRRSGLCRCLLDPAFRQWT